MAINMMAPVFLVMAYPVLVHVSIWFQLLYLQGLAILALVAGVLYGGLKNMNKFAWSVFILIVLLSLLLSAYDVVFYVLYLPPIIIPLVFFIVFFSTLLPGRIPLVTAIGENSRGPLSTEMRIYTRQVTWLWSVVLFAILVWSILLPLFASDFVWSLFTNFINYVLIGALFLGEFIYRKHLFRDHDHPGFVEYVKIVITANVIGKSKEY